MTERGFGTVSRATKRASERGGNTSTKGPGFHLRTQLARCVVNGAHSSRWSLEAGDGHKNLTPTGCVRRLQRGRSREPSHEASRFLCGCRPGSPSRHCVGARRTVPQLPIQRVGERTAGYRAGRSFQQRILLSSLFSPDARESADCGAARTLFDRIECLAC